MRLTCATLIARNAGAMVFRLSSTLSGLLTTLSSRSCGVYARNFMPAQSAHPANAPQPSAMTCHSSVCRRSFESGRVDRSLTITRESRSELSAAA